MTRQVTSPRSGPPCSCGGAPGGRELHVAGCHRRGLGGSRRPTFPSAGRALGARRGGVPGLGRVLAGSSLLRAPQARGRSRPRWQRPCLQCARPPIMPGTTRSDEVTRLSQLDGCPRPRRLCCRTSRVTSARRRGRTSTKSVPHGVPQTGACWDVLEQPGRTEGRQTLGSGASSGLPGRP